MRWRKCTLLMSNGNPAWCRRLSRSDPKSSLWQAWLGTIMFYHSTEGCWRPRFKIAWVQHSFVRFLKNRLCAPAVSGPIKPQAPGSSSRRRKANWQRVPQLRHRCRAYRNLCDTWRMWSASRSEPLAAGPAAICVGKFNQVPSISPRIRPYGNATIGLVARGRLKLNAHGSHLAIVRL